VLNLDIGGGTTDITVVEYEDRRPGAGVDLVATVLFRESSTIAGDALVRRAIESVLLPALAEGWGEQDKAAFAALLAQQKGRARALWNRITRQVFVPMVHAWLGAACRQELPAGQAPTPQDMYPLGVMADVLKEFEELCKDSGLPITIERDRPFKYDPELLSRCVRESFAGLFRSLAKVIEAFDCDLVLVAGKPSELAALRNLSREELPLLPERILFATDTRVGDWYPLDTDGGRIQDAKTVTVAGAALHQAIKRGLMGPGWRITRRISPHLLTRNYWGTMPQGGEPRFGALLLEPHEDVKQCRLQVGERIGRRMLPADTRPEPVYELRWKDRTRYRSGGDSVNALVDVTLQRVPPTAGGVIGNDQVPQSESLEIAAVDAGVWNNQPIKKDDLDLSLCTLEADSHWLDAGTFQVQWPKPDGLAR
jgi:hypothetical protein